MTKRLSDAERERWGRRVRDIWVAYAKANPDECEDCCGSGLCETPCFRCDDSTDDHDCPPSKPCANCDGTGKFVDPRHVMPWEELNERDREVERQTGETIASEAVAAAGRPGPPGLFGKFMVARADGSALPAEAKLFVLRYDTDPHAQHALWEYAESCASENPQLAADLRRAVLEFVGPKGGTP